MVADLKLWCIKLSNDVNSHYLDKFGCSFGQVNSQRLSDLEARQIELSKEMKDNIKAINNKLWVMILLLITNMAGIIAYLLTRGSGP